MRVKYFVTSIIALSGVAEAFNLAQTQASLDYDITDDIRNQLAQTLQDPIPAVDPVVPAKQPIDGGPGVLPPKTDEPVKKAVVDPEPIKGGPSVLPPPEIKKIAKTEQIDGGPGTTTPVK